MECLRRFTAELYSEEFNSDCSVADWIGWEISVLLSAAFASGQARFELVSGLFEGFPWVCICVSGISVNWSISDGALTMFSETMLELWDAVGERSNDW